MATRKKTAKTDTGSGLVLRVFKGAKCHEDEPVAATLSCVLALTPAALKAIGKLDGVEVVTYQSKAGDTRYRITGGKLNASAFVTGAVARLLADTLGNPKLAMSPAQAAEIAATGEALHRGRDQSAVSLPDSW